MGCFGICAAAQVHGLEGKEHCGYYHDYFVLQNFQTQYEMNKTDFFHVIV